MKKSVIIITAVLIAIGGVFYFRYQVYFSHSEFKEKKIFEIRKGDGIESIAGRLKNEDLISGKAYFYYYLRSRNLLNRILPGKYELSGQMTIPEIAAYITQEDNILPGYKKITFPEGWSAKQMAERLNANGLPGGEFLKLTESPDKEIVSRYEYLKEIKNLEGYLFPDTYFFAKDTSGERIISRMLSNFDERLAGDLRKEMQKQGKTIRDIIIMASIIENEVRSDEDRALVSGIYWNRLKIGQPLQSDITLAYILGENKKQYSIADTKTPSPYNTYLNKGLPPGPINNPGLSAIRAAVYPKDSEYNYYLSDPKTGATVFARTFEEHKANKEKYGL